MNTKNMEKALLYCRSGLGRYFAREVMMPSMFKGGCGSNNERVDFIEVRPVWRHSENKKVYDYYFFELKLTKSDFNSKCKHTFLGNYNYYVVPDYLYSKIIDQVPDHVGVYVITEISAEREIYKAYCKKKPKRQDCDVPGLENAFHQAACRDALKYYFSN